MGVWVFLHTDSLVTLSAIHNFRTKDAGEEGKLFFPPFCFTSASAGTGSWTCISPCPAEHVNTEAQTQALLAVGSPVDQLADEEKVCLHCWRLVFAARPEHRIVTGGNLHTTHIPECKTLLSALCVLPAWQGKVTAPSSAPKAGKTPVTLLKATTG